MYINSIAQLHLLCCVCYCFDIVLTANRRLQVRGPEDIGAQLVLIDLRGNNGAFAANSFGRSR